MWFGKPWPGTILRAPACADDAEQVPVPVGRACTLCTEPIQAGDRGHMIGHLPSEGPATLEPVHVECLLRNVVGNHVHVTGGCDHTGDCHDKSDLTYRQEAVQVWEIMQQRDGYSPSEDSVL